jgi:uncharacterized phage protein (TIGR01671 family)
MKKTKINYNRFKFRIYDFKTKKMTYLENESMGFDLPAIIAECKKGNCALMQCTGFIDQNNNLIYEGDWLKGELCYINKEMQNITHYSDHTVIFSNGCFHFRLGNNKDYQQPMIMQNNDADFMKFDMEIVGNIYENIDERHES